MRQSIKHSYHAKLSFGTEYNDQLRSSVSCGRKGREVIRNNGKGKMADLNCFCENSSHLLPSFHFSASRPSVRNVLDNTRLPLAPRATSVRIQGLGPRYLATLKGPENIEGRSRPVVLESFSRSNLSPAREGGER
jgi:hypothetical protein